MTNATVKAAMERREDAGLKLAFSIPGRTDLYTCFAKDEAQKAEWLANAAAKGWTLH